MKRRTLLRGLGAAGTLALTGCLSDGPDGEPTDTDEPTDTATPPDEGTGTDRPSATPDRAGDTVTEPDPGGTDDPGATPSDSPADTASGTPDGEPSATPGGVSESSLDVTDSGCGTQTDDASVEFDTSGGTVTVTGTIWGSDACYTAVLSDVSLDGDALTVTVAAERDAGTAIGCADCITEIDYEATVAFDGGLPREVAVVHDHDGEDTRVTSTTR